jgi:hypothetical protein
MLDIINLLYSAKQKQMTKKVDRKVFYLGGDKSKPVTSGGVIIYRFFKKSMELLMIESRGFFEDFGGRVDDADQSVEETVQREADEESNGLIDRKSVKDRLTGEPIYMEKCKYVVHIIKATDAENCLTTEDFGDTEIHDNLKRKVKWISLDTFLLPEIIKYKLNFRLKSKALFDRLKEIREEKKLSTNMFSKSIGKKSKKVSDDETNGPDDSNDSSDSSNSSDSEKPCSKKPIVKSSKNIFNLTKNM